MCSLLFTTSYNKSAHGNKTKCNIFKNVNLTIISTQYFNILKCYNIASSVLV